MLHRLVSLHRVRAAAEKSAGAARSGAPKRQLSRGSNGELEGRETGGGRGGYPGQQGMGKQAALREEKSPGCSEMG